MADFDDRSGRDSRLLGLVIVIAVTVLVVLARFRFSGAETRPTAVTPGPLERLAARTTYDDLAAAVHTALQRVEPALFTLSLEPDSPPARGGRGEAAAAAAGADARNRIGVRLGDDWAIVHVPRGYRLVRTPDDGLVVRELDAAKEIAIVTRPVRSGEDQLPAGPAELAGFLYVCVVESMPDEPTAMPVFIGRVRTVLDDRWGDSLLVPGAMSGLAPGSLLFQLDGRFLGLVVSQPGGGVAVVPASLLTAAVTAARGRAAGGVH